MRFSSFFVLLTEINFYFLTHSSSEMDSLECVRDLQNYFAANYDPHSHVWMNKTHLHFLLVVALLSPHHACSRLEEGNAKVF